jgi:hypothetical protein
VNQSREIIFERTTKDAHEGLSACGFQRKRESSRRRNSARLNRDVNEIGIAAALKFKDS